MQLNPGSFLPLAASFAVALSSVSCSSMNFGGSENSGSGAYGGTGAQAPYGAGAQQQPYYGQNQQAQQQPYYGGQGYQQTPNAAYGDAAYQPSATGQGYPAAPSSYAPAPGTGAGSSHVVARGDTLWSISQRYRTTVGAIQGANNLASDVIRPGDVLQIP